MNKAQLSMMMVLGLILLIIIGSTIIVVKHLTGTKPPIATEKKKIDEVREYTSKCLEEYTKEALIKVGQHGGYIYPKRYGVIAIKGFPEFGNGVELVDGLLIPYWYYTTTNNPCSFETMMPPLEGTSNSIEKQIELYIKENIDECLDNYEQFKEQGFIVSHGDISIDVDFGEEKTLVKMKMPTTINSSGFRANINEYRAELDLPFKKFYDYAYQLAFNEYTDGLFAYSIYRIIQPLSYLEEIPPMGLRTDISYLFPDQKFWIRSDVEEKIKGLLTYEIPRITTTESYNAFYGYTISENMSIDQAIENKYIREVYNIPVTDEVSIPLLRVNTIYLPRFGLDLRITPGRGIYTVRNTKIFPPKLPVFNAFMDMIFPKVYSSDKSFFYDLSVPIVINLYSPKPFNWEGYSFMFAIKPRIYMNKPLSLTTCNASFFETNNKPSDDLCNPLFFSGSRIHLDISTPHGYNYDELYITYKCGPIECFIPFELNESTGMYDLQLPVCLGGSLVVSSPGFLSQSVKLDSTGEEEERLLNIKLYPLNYTVKAYIKELVMEKSESIDTSLLGPGRGLANLYIGMHEGSIGAKLASELLDKLEESFAPYWYFSGIDNDGPENDEEILLILSPNGSGFPTMGRFTPGNYSINLSLVPGNYSLVILHIHYLGESYTQKNLTLSIPDDIRCVGVAGINLKCEGPENVTINSSMLIGGASIDRFEIT
ncbi:hypothetical protein J7K74_01170, partial [Candidatus Woesearchaeota archaeon]|nr:hypothetical protein [Candidatus Woesearchaeota archaeon]